MADIIRVADYILEKSGAIPTMKLQKLAYYSQACHLVSYDEVLFDSEIQAWANGPVIVDLFNAHRGKFIISRGELPVFGDSCELDDKQKACIDRVIAIFGSWTGNQLSELTHKEAPWLDQRKGYAPGARCENIIAPEAMRSFYSSSSCGNPLFA